MDKALVALVEGDWSNRRLRRWNGGDGMERMGWDGGMGWRG